MSRMTLDHYALDPQAAVAGGDPYVLCEPGWPINVNELVFCPEGPATVAQLLEALGRPANTIVADAVFHAVPGQVLPN
jgi:hypothetical protein